MSDWNAETAEWYAEKYGEYPTNKVGVDELDLVEHLTIVDVGCGTGSALRHAASKMTGGKFIGVDPVQRMVEIAKERTENQDVQNRIEYRLGSAENLPIADDIADYVWAFDSIDHWQNFEKGLTEVKRVLHPTGKFVVIKDKSVPGAKQAVKNVRFHLISIGFNLLVERDISSDGVSFSFLVFEIRK